MGNNLSSVFYFTAFLEGFSVLAVELCGAKILSSYFGSSLYIWSIVLLITMLGLSFGYFIGSRLSKRSNPEQVLYPIIILTASCIMITPIIAKVLYHVSVPQTVYPGMFLCGTIILIPSLVLLGTIIPLIASITINTSGSTGKAVGKLFFVSTFGAITGVFLFGFYLIPEFGLTRSLSSCGILLGLPVLVTLIKQKRWIIITYPLAIILFIMSGYRDQPEYKMRVVESKEGINGRLSIVDIIDPETKNVNERMMLVNQIIQSSVKYESGAESYSPYVHLIDSLIPHANDNNALLLGVAAGNVAKIMQNKGYTVTGCEFDKRISEAAARHFDLNDVRLVVDDARHFVKTSTEKFDLIVTDVFKGESNPSHVITRESLDEIKNLLNPTGQLIINSNGYISGEIGLGNRSILKTLQVSGFNTTIKTTCGRESRRNLIFIAKPSKTKYGVLSAENISTSDGLVSINQISLDHAFVLSDNYPLLEVLNKNANLQWRQNYLRFFSQRFKENAIPYFD